MKWIYLIILTIRFLNERKKDKNDIYVYALIIKIVILEEKYNVKNNDKRCG